MTLNEMYDYSTKEKIEVYNYTLTKKKAFTARINRSYCIAMDYGKIHEESEERLILSEELGHCATNALYYIEDVNNPCRYTNILKAERRAKNWALQALVPLPRLLECVRQKKTEMEMAAYFEVPIACISQAIEMYRTKNLI